MLSVFISTVLSIAIKHFDGNVAKQIANGRRPIQTITHLNQMQYVTYCGRDA